MSDRLQQSSSVIATDLSVRETVMLDPDAAKYFGMTETGPAVWREFAGSSSVDEVISRLCVKFDVVDDLIRDDVEWFVAELRERNLLVATD